MVVSFVQTEWIWGADVWIAQYKNGPRKKKILKTVM